jgi:hypothetical protein
MRRRRVLAAGAAAALLLGTGCAQAAAGSADPVLRYELAGAAGVWGRAIAVPGLAALNKGREAAVSSVSCPSPGSCAAVGFYTDGGGHRRGFVVSERNGRWRQAAGVPGLGALNMGGNPEVSSVSCGSPGFCAAVGTYRSHGRQGFVVSERNGRWRRAVQVPGLGALNKGGNAKVTSVSCASRGSCAAVGFYTDGGGHGQGFVAVERSGVWGRAAGVPGLAALNKGGGAGVTSVSCGSPGNCAAGGYYASDTLGRVEAFVVSETNGSWGTAQQVAANLNTGPYRDTFVEAVSCASAGNCAAGGQFSKGSGDQAFVVSEVNGTWAAARAVAGTLSTSGGSEVTSVSCATAGNCAAGGQWDYGGYNAAFLVNEKNGVWGPGIDVPGLSRVARDAYLHSVSCASPGNCAAGGSYDGFGSGAWVVRETNAVWGKQTTVPGLGVLDVNSVSCASAGSCTAGGFYQLRSSPYGLQGFVTQ